jgi:hypothetical protein
MDDASFQREKVLHGLARQEKNETIIFAPYQIPLKNMG